MADTNIILPSNFDIKNITITEQKSLENGSRVCFIGYNFKKCIFQTPKMSAPFGLKNWNPELPVKDYSLDLSFKRMNENKVMKQFFDNMKALDEHMVDLGYENRQKWLKQKETAPRAVVEALYSPIVRLAKDKNGDVTDKYPPTFKFKLPHNGTAFTIPFFDENGNPIDGNSLDLKGATVSALVQATGVWFGLGKFGVTFKAIQLMVTQARSEIKGFAFQPIEDDDVPKDIEEESEDAEESEIEESEDDLDTKGSVDEKLAEMSIKEEPVKKPTIKKTKK